MPKPEKAREGTKPDYFGLFADGGISANFKVHILPEIFGRSFRESTHYRVNIRGDFMIYSDNLSERSPFEGGTFGTAQPF